MGRISMKLLVIHGWPKGYPKFQNPTYVGRGNVGFSTIAFLFCRYHLVYRYSLHLFRDIRITIRRDAQLVLLPLQFARLRPSGTT